LFKFYFWIVLTSKISR